MQHKVTVAIMTVVLLFCAGLVGWQAWSITQMRAQITALQRRVGNSNTGILPGTGTQAQPLTPPSSLFGGGNGLNTDPNALAGNQNDPFAAFDQLQEEMLDHMQQLMGRGIPGKLFDDDFAGGSKFGFGSNSNAQESDLNMSENDEAYVITIPIPEDSNAEVSASVDGNELDIEAKITVKSDNSTNGSTFMSTQSRQFARSMPLPPDADPDGLTNVTENNQVVITIPKQA